MSEEKPDQPKSTGSEEFLSLHNVLKILTLTSVTRDINILLLGETGVGKSTFINAFFNYISFPTLWKAKNERIHVVIPSQFTITDDSYEERTVKIGKSPNESIAVGASGTQACRSYVYFVQGTNVKIRLIDTPGVGDTRGIDQDNVNFENVLSCIGNLNHLNAICVLLKPNNSRLTVMFEFCIKQLLSRLEKSASQNLIFVFTNTRGTFYRPGETLPSLKKLLATLKDVNILCKRRNIFCTDNESFRFLAALKNGVRFSTEDMKSFSWSWNQSSRECLRMISYIVGDNDNLGLIPHEVKNTISINEARRLVVQLSQPLADIAELLEDNIRALDSHRIQLQVTATTLSELKTKLYVPVVDLRVNKLNKPITVCSSLKCSTVYQVGNEKKWHYHQKCHAPCHLRNASKELIGTPQLLNCAAMDQNGVCLICSCRYQVHMHIYYETETFQRQLKDQTVNSTIESKEQAYQSALNLTKTITNRISTLEKGKDEIMKTTARFACFLKTNAIAPYNDAYEAYLEYLIDREKSLNEETDFKLIEQLKKMLRAYTEEKTTIMNAISQAKNSTAVIKADDIFDAIKSLYALEIVGPKIKELVEAQSGARKDEYQSQTKEFVFGAYCDAEKGAVSRRGHWRGRGTGRPRVPWRGYVRGRQDLNQQNLQSASPPPLTKVETQFSNLNQEQRSIPLKETDPKNILPQYCDSKP